MPKKALIGVTVVIALAGCGSSHPTALSHPKTKATLSVQGQSFKDGLTAGKGIAIPNESDGEVRVNCEVTELQQMPVTDIKSRWMACCFAGTVLGMVALDQAGNGG